MMSSHTGKLEGTNTEGNVQSKTAISRPVHEADAYCHINFHIHRKNSTKIISEVECGMAVLISGLKEDLSLTFDARPENQLWYFKDELMLDTKSLKDYIVNSGQKNLIIKVKL